jgi:hypothetical protein
MGWQKATSRRKNTGHRDDCHGGLLFPPEQVSLCILFTTMQVDIQNLVRLVAVGLSVASSAE